MATRTAIHLGGPLPEVRASRRSAREAADPHERESVTVRTAQVPRWRIRFLEHDDDDSQQGGDFHASRACGWMHPAEVADAVLTRRQHVLQIAAHKRVRGERAFLAFLWLTFVVLTAVAVACLTIYDMIKAVERGVRIEGIHLVEKKGGKSGHYRAGD